MSKKTNVSWIKPAEPSFLRKFKNDVGFKEGPTVDTKREELPKFDDDSGDSDREDEKPQVVVLKKGHLSAEEVQKIKGKIKDSKSEGKPAAEGKIIFKKPEKRSSEKFQGITASSSKKRKQQQQQQQQEEEEEEEEEKEKEKEKESQKGKEENEGKKVKNSSLLSFGDDNDDEDDDDEEDEEDDDED
ncbi:hypothetical protein SKAU_G00218700 [Synaphobranchus kaupii]|uniref:DUF4604 domain-containing protein n=1 Tax=Synaphobranchus kaupii TaxID=118154 RepID=A0A9Q1IVT1_SYNKA|nr:hypothetical protein SKAU_G00218700 [Synaphobranchus kaupii]